MLANKSAAWAKEEDELGSAPGRDMEQDNMEEQLRMAAQIGHMLLQSNEELQKRWEDARRRVDELEEELKHTWKKLEEEAATRYEISAKNLQLENTVQNLTERLELCEKKLFDEATEKRQLRVSLAESESLKARVQGRLDDATLELSIPSRSSSAQDANAVSRSTLEHLREQNAELELQIRELQEASHHHTALTDSLKNELALTEQQLLKFKSVEISDKTADVSLSSESVIVSSPPMATLRMPKDVSRSVSSSVHPSIGEVVSKCMNLSDTSLSHAIRTLTLCLPLAYICSTHLNGGTPTTLHSHTVPFNIQAVSRQIMTSYSRTHGFVRNLQFSNTEQLPLHSTVVIGRALEELSNAAALLDTLENFVQQAVPINAEAHSSAVSEKVQIDSTNEHMLKNALSMGFTSQLQHLQHVVSTMEHTELARQQAVRDLQMRLNSVLRTRTCSTQHIEGLQRELGEVISSLRYNTVSSHIPTQSRSPVRRTSSAISEITQLFSLFKSFSFNRGAAQPNDQDIPAHVLHTSSQDSLPASDMYSSALDSSPDSPQKFSPEPLLNLSLQVSMRSPRSTRSEHEDAFPVPYTSLKQQILVERLRACITATCWMDISDACTEMDAQDANMQTINEALKSWTKGLAQLKYVRDWLKPLLAGEETSSVPLMITDVCEEPCITLMCALVPTLYRRCPGARVGVDVRPSIRNTIVAAVGEESHTADGPVCNDARRYDLRIRVQTDRGSGQVQDVETSVP